MTDPNNVRPTPRALGYRMPAEWEPHEATWLSWPHKEESWPGAFDRVPEIFTEIAGHLAESELVRINVADEDFAARVREQLKKGGVNLDAVRFHLNPTNDAWVRDHGPIYVVRDRDGERKRAIIDWGYNAWGNKYPPYDLDDAIPQRIAEESGEQLYQPGIVLEGGSIDVNGRGALLTTESCLLNPNRNPHLDKNQIEQYLRAYLGVDCILWLGDGIVGDDTDGHIDDLTRFVSHDTVVTAVEEDPGDENYPPLRDNLERLQSMKDQDGEPLRIITVPMPAPVYFDGQRLPASYANFYIANRAVLAPTYRCENDARAIAILQELFPDRRTIGIDCTEMVWGLGAIHCATQQQPRGKER
ncbi:MAG: agmatine deiminase family protein [Blastocatellales bacterium]|nr:agmatine deiminase family protein [Blastocatellales bacterium]